MSSTNRNYERQDQDYYVTPDWAVSQLLDAITSDGPELFGFDFTLEKLNILDPCAGGDSQNEMAYPSEIVKRKDWLCGVLDTMDIRQDSRADIKADFLHTDAPLKGQYDLVITNPPFDKSAQIIMQALKQVKPGGLVVMLQRINFFGSKERQALFNVGMPFGFGMPVATYAHSKRLRFMKGINARTGKPWPGDSIEYAHFVWQQGINPRFTKLRILNYEQ